MQQKNFDFLCEDCHKNKEEYIPDIRFNHSLFLLDLQNAGLQYEIDDLSIMEWKWLSKIKQAIKQFEMEELKKKTKNG